MGLVENNQTNLSYSTKTIIGGFVMLIIAMGIGRFSYTSILPLMQAQAHLSGAESGYLAGSNNLGYLVAAFGAGFITWGNRKAYHLRIQLILCLLTTGLMGIASSFYVWILLRFLSGMSSGFIFVLSSSLVLNALISAKREKWVGVFFGGVGTGIALTGLMTPILSHFTWRGTWIGLPIIGFVLLMLVWPFVREDKTIAVNQHPVSSASPGENASIFGWLLFMYGLEGLGYIVSATFLVAMVKHMPQIASFADYSWIIVGIAAIPSTVLWSWWTSKAGYIKPLITALILQAAGVILPVWLPNLLGVIVGSILFGGTFMGIAMLAISAARIARPTSGNKAIALMTGFFGIGQILGPIGAGMILEMTHSYRLSLILATLVLVLAVTILLVGAVLTHNKRSISNA
ncbi:YbfB/YjiJ family MFS transporter [Paenibacillus sp. CF384]|uniref:YbfB/YjiJ family MFS transporter n=1 Tax=Paenibacillus sp. CF384 TaxID=1884382 RepID=UPI00089C2976|nr:YbfB/YjiJ family MFS transporter [Paenibacillus sp. CF384]SDW07524.1 Predicted arabinose efflux permease, MFS family [Paenibacillus sp. CF384]